MYMAERLPGRPLTPLRTAHSIALVKFGQFLPINRGAISRTSAMRLSHFHFDSGWRRLRCLGFNLALLFMGLRADVALPYRPAQRRVSVAVVKMLVIIPLICMWHLAAMAIQDSHWGALEHNINGVMRSWGVALPSSGNYFKLYGVC